MLHQHIFVPEHFPTVLTRNRIFVGLVVGVALTDIHWVFRLLLHGIAVLMVFIVSDIIVAAGFSQCND